MFVVSKTDWRLQHSAGRYPASIAPQLWKKRLDIGCLTARQVVRKLFTIAVLLIAVNTNAAIIYDNTNVVVQPFVGSAFYGHVDGQGENTMFGKPNGLTWLGNTILVSDGTYVRGVTRDGFVSTLVTNLNFRSHCEDVFFAGTNGVSADSNGLIYRWDNAFITSFETNNCLTTDYPLGSYNYPGHIMAVTATGTNIFAICQNRVWRWESNKFEVFVGSGNMGTNDGNGLFCSFEQPVAITSDSHGNLFVHDSITIRKITPERNVTTYAGKWTATGYNDGPPGVATLENGGANYPKPHMAMDGNGNVYIAKGNSIRKVYPDGTIKTLAGSGSSAGYTNGTHSIARFNGLGGICVDTNGDVYVADANNYRIRKITQPYEVSVSPADISLATYPGLTINGIPGRNYRVESSADFTNWTTAATFTLPTNPHLWIDTNSVSGQKKFYRATLLP